MSRAFIFPGQASQAVGMGKSLAEAFAPARRVFEEADEALSLNLSRLIWEGPEADLTLTENAQPAIMTVSLAVARVLQEEAGLDLEKHACLVAGHSLGEWTALCAAGAFALPDAVRLVHIRGRAIQKAVPIGEGAMSACLGVEIEIVEAACEEAKATGVVVVANDNAPGQIVISGYKEAVEKAGEIVKAKGARRVVPLSVSGPFHSPMLSSAADTMREALEAIDILPPSVPVVANMTAALTSEPDEIRELLIEQVTGRVRWRESVTAFRALGAGMTVEAGGNKVLTGMVKRIDKDLETVSLDSPADIEEFAKTL